MQQLLAAVRTQAAMVQGEQVSTRTGIIKSFNPDIWAVKVQLLPENVMTNWIPLLSPWVGSGWGMFAAPNPGDLIEVGFDEGSPDGGYAWGRFFTDLERPLPVQSGECWLVHASGAFFKLTNDGKLSLADAHGASIVLNNDGTVQLTGDLHVAGNIFTTGDVTAGSISLEHHTHGGVKAGGDSTGAPQ